MKSLIKRLILEGIEDDYKQRLIKDNPYLGMQMVNHYVNEFKKIKDNLPPDKRDITKYSWEDLEQVVDSNQSIEKIEKGMIEVDNSDVIYNQNNLKILKANTKQACIKYGTGYGFCISSRGAGNMYYNYRYGNYYDTREKSIYFVIDEDKTKDIKSTSPLRFVDPTHMLVIMVTNIESSNPYTHDGRYVGPKEYLKKGIFYQVTNANNDGDKNMGWYDIVELQPKLNYLQKLFQPLKPNPKEYTLHIAKKAFIDRIRDWREENHEWLGKQDYSDLILDFSDTASLAFYTNGVEELELNYKLLKKLKEISVNGKIQVIEITDRDNNNRLKFLTPLLSNEEDESRFKYNILNYFLKLNIKSGFEADADNPLIKKDGIFIDAYIENSDIFKKYFRYETLLYVKRNWFTLDKSFYRYSDEIEKLYREYINDITYTLANT